VNLPPSGGGQVGALLLSPFVKPGTFDQEPFNDFSLLRTIENLFGLPPLGYAAMRGLSSFEASVFSAWAGAPASSS
jgi:phosphatidylinositol-3-phosphatase